MKSAHLKGGKGPRPHPTKMDGKRVETDSYYMYNMAFLVGCPVEVTVRDGRKYDGIFSALASEKHELILENAHVVTNEKCDDEEKINEHYDYLVVPTDKMLSARFKSVDCHYATRDFVTDQAIAATRGGNTRDKELTPWDGSDGVSDEETDLSLDVGGANGWEAKEMFKKNEEKYGVTTSFKQDLVGYTTQLDKTDADSFKKHEQQASQIAQEIEKNTQSSFRTELENGDDEEEAFSAVVRPRHSGGHSNLNNNNNNNNNSSSSGGSDKYIPPSRRQGSVQTSAQPMPQNLPVNNNGANQMNNNSGNPRKPIFSQNQNPRGGNYGAPPSNVYHDRRNNYESRRAPPVNQYPNPNSHNDFRRMEDGNRQQQQRIVNKASVDRRGGRDDPGKLKEFGNNFRLQNSTEQNQPRRIPHNQPPGNANTNATTSSTHGNAAAGPARNPSPPSSASNKTSKEEILASPPSQISLDVADKSSSSSGNVSASSTSSPNIGTPTLTPANESSTSGTSSMDLSLGSGDSRNCEDAKHKFKFNPNAKEFNPSAKSFSPRSPSTPPRPPSTPASVNTPQQQIMQTQPIHSYMQIPIPMMYAHAQPYAQGAPLTPSSNSSGSSGGTTPRHGGHRRGMLGVPPRSEMTPPIQMTAGPPLLAPAIQASSQQQQQQYAFLPPGHFSQVMPMRVVSQNVMPVYQTEGGGTSQMHQQVHYIQHNGAAGPNSAGHPSNATQQNNPNAQTAVVPQNGQAYGQASGNHGGAPLNYPFVGVPVMGYPHPHQHMISVPYVSHSHQGGAAVIPQSQ